MKAWSTGGPNPRGDLYSDEEPVQPAGICQQFQAMKYIYRSVPKEMVNEMLEAVGLRRAPK